MQKTIWGLYVTDMVKLPRKCRQCGAKLMHYGSCSCLDAQLSYIDEERRLSLAKLDDLDKLESKLLGLRAQTER